VVESESIAGMMTVRNVVVEMGGDHIYNTARQD
jgi:hypothetical protein